MQSHWGDYQWETFGIILMFEILYYPVEIQVIHSLISKTKILVSRTILHEILKISDPD
jgi:hypothetical protein